MDRQHLPLERTAERLAVSRQSGRDGSKQSQGSETWAPWRSASTNDNQAVAVADSAAQPASNDVFPAPTGATNHREPGAGRFSFNMSSRRSRAPVAPVDAASLEAAASVTIRSPQSPPAHDLSLITTLVPLVTGLYILTVRPGRTQGPSADRAS